MYAAKVEVGAKIGWLTFSKKGLFSFSIPKVNVSQPANTILKKISIAEELEAYFKGVKVDFNAKINWAGFTDFEIKTLKSCQRIKYGETASYKELAFMINKGNSFRAVGNVLTSNRLPVIIPCHRIIRSNSSLGGFSGGTSVKKELLDLEKKWLKMQTKVNLS